MDGDWRKMAPERRTEQEGEICSCQAAMGPPFTAARVRNAGKAGSPDEACSVRRR